MTPSNRKILHPWNARFRLVKSTVRAADSRLVVCARYNKYSVVSLIWHSLAGAGSIVANLARWRPTVLETECVGRITEFFRSALAPALTITFLYGFGFAYFAVTRMPSAQLFQDLAMPHMGGIFFLYVIPAAITSLVVIRGVVTLTSDLASMRASQELDALEVASLHPARFVFLPRALALIVGTPALFILGVFASFFGAWLACQFSFAPPINQFWEQFIYSVTSLKALVAFGKVAFTTLIMTFVAGYFGFGGQTARVETVGSATTDAVVTVTLAIATVNILAGLLLDP